MDQWPPWMISMRHSASMRLWVTPQDRFGNYVGPGYAKYIQLKFENAKATSPVRDLLDGSYTQTFSTANFDSVGAGEAEIFGEPIDVPGLVEEGGFSLHAGLVTPYGAFSNSHDNGFTFNLDYSEYPSRRSQARSALRNSL